MPGGAPVARHSCTGGQSRRRCSGYWMLMRRLTHAVRGLNRRCASRQGRSPRRSAVSGKLGAAQEARAERGERGHGLAWAGAVAASNTAVAGDGNRRRCCCCPYLLCVGNRLECRGWLEARRPQRRGRRALSVFHKPASPATIALA
ncbi:hypothetical protein D1007_01947 [Hordeum vulgare]|nr:hypothetical protein D1007_01947 [Hordeum vulgare]